MKTPRRRSIRPSTVLVPRGKFTLDELERLAIGASYRSNLSHKREMFDGEAGQARLDLDKTLCDGTGTNTQEASEDLLREAFRRGMVSQQVRQRWPQNVWAVDQSGEVYQANLANSATGEYHGFPIRSEGRFLAHIRAAWAERAR